jgi:hypothetical protein
VDNMTWDARRHACRKGETRLAQKIRALRPQTVVTVVRSIRANVKRAQTRAGWSGPHLELPYPGRWHRHRTKFRRLLIPFLRQTLRGFVSSVARAEGTVSATIQRQNCVN